MQFSYSLISRLPVTPVSIGAVSRLPTIARIRSVLLVVIVLLTGGCGPAEPANPTSQGPDALATPVELRIACPDPIFAREFRHRASSWAAKTGAKLSVLETDPDPVEKFDLAIVPPSTVGRFATQNKLAALPADIRRSNSELRWDKIITAYRKDLAGWAGSEVGLPVGGDGFLIVYRQDRLNDPAFVAGLKARAPQAQLPPRSYEDIEDIARHAQETSGKPSLAPLPSDDRQLATLFNQIAACYTRPSESRGGVGAAGPEVKIDTLEFHFDLRTGQPRLTSPGFVTALEWLARSHRFRPDQAGDPVVALDEGSAVIAILSLAEVARLPRTQGIVDKRFGLAPLPGTEEVYGPEGERLKSTGKENFIPYLGSYGQIGIVFGHSKQQSAAWELLAASASPSGSLALMANPTAGVGPFRTDHVLDNRGWLPYGFDADRTQQLRDAMQRYVSVEISTPALPLRIPRAEEFMARLAVEVRAAATGSKRPAEALEAASAAWEKLAANSSDGEFLKQLRNAAGLQ